MSQTLEIVHTLSHDSVALQLAELTRALFEARKTSLTRGVSEEIDLSTALSQLNLPDLAVELMGDNPQRTPDGVLFIRRTGLKLRCADNTIRQRIEQILLDSEQHPGSRLRPALQLQGVHSVHLYLQDDYIGLIPIQAPMQNDAQIRPYHSRPLGRWHMFIEQCAQRDHQLILPTLNLALRDELISDLRRPREWNTLYRLGFRHLHLSRYNITIDGGFDTHPGRASTLPKPHAMIEDSHVVQALRDAGIRPHLALTAELLDAIELAFEHHSRVILDMSAAPLEPLNGRGPLRPLQLLRVFRQLDALLNENGFSWQRDEHNVRVFYVMPQQVPDFELRLRQQLDRLAQQLPVEGRCQATLHASIADWCRLLHQHPERSPSIILDQLVQSASGVRYDSEHVMQTLHTILRPLFAPVDVVLQALDSGDYHYAIALKFIDPHQLER